MEENSLSTAFSDLKTYNSCNRSWNGNSEAFGNFIYLPLSVIAMATLICLMNVLMLLLVLASKKLRTLSNAVFCSSCCCGILIAFTLMAISLTGNFALEPLKTKILGCALDSPTQVTLVCIFNTHISLMTCERCYSVIFPFRYRRLATKRNIIVILLLAWIIPICLIYIVAMLSSRIYFQDCTSWAKIVNVKVFITFIASPIIFLFPIAFTLTAYIIIISKIYSLERKVTRINGIDSKCYSRRTYLMVKNKKAILQMVLLLSIYIICLFPFCIIYVELVPTTVKYGFISKITYYLATTYYFIHPLLVAFFTAPIKEEIVKLWQRYCYCADFLQQLCNRPKIIRINSNTSNASREYIANSIDKFSFQKNC
ncbi:Pyroglutamylated RFamide peptide receptor [Trichoplax sp. H2]|nr:Pyroglutamylated RFamide peptide receptor [Trichoplax sp. H2]|eukprot:RDD37482.1 Pyroglutamylated RFamide peptide receptor [Trichoplax sp. H2]